MQLKDISSDFSLKTLSIALKNSGKYEKLIEKTRFFMVWINFFQALYLGVNIFFVYWAGIKNSLFVIAAIYPYEKLFKVFAKVHSFMEDKCC